MTIEWGYKQNKSKIQTKLDFKIDDQEICDPMVIVNKFCQYFTVIVWLAPRVGKMNQIARCDWLPEGAR